MNFVLYRAMQSQSKPTLAVGIGNNKIQCMHGKITCQLLLQDGDSDKKAALQQHTHGQNTISSACFIPCLGYTQIASCQDICAKLIRTS